MHKTKDLLLGPWETLSWLHESCTGAACHPNRPKWGTTKPWFCLGQAMCRPKRHETIKPSNHHHGYNILQHYNMVIYSSDFEKAHLFSLHPWYPLSDLSFLQQLTPCRRKCSDPMCPIPPSCASKPTSWTDNKQNENEFERNAWRHQILVVTWQGDRLTMSPLSTCVLARIAPLSEEALPLMAHTAQTFDEHP